MTFLSRRRASSTLHISYSLVMANRLSAQLETLARGLDDRAHFLGQRMDVPLLLAGCDSEAPPTILIEAAASGLPVVAS